MIILETTVLVASLFYCAALLYIRRGIVAISRETPSQTQSLVSVIIAARNEEDNIGACLYSVLQQNYPRFEVIVVNDNSDDATRSVAGKIAAEKKNVHILDLQASIEKVAPKKAAISLGIKNSRGDIIVTTDADCIVQPTWLESIVQNFDSNTGAVLSWLLVEEKGRWLDKIEYLDSLFYSAIGCGMIGQNRPLIANGANFAYRKELFEKVGGFKGAEHYASGDDDLFLQKLARQKEYQVVFNPAAGAVVKTRPAGSLGKLISQRLRWASKGPVYPSLLLYAQVLIYLFFAGLLFSGLWFILNPLSLLFAALAFGIKLTSDIFFFAALRAKFSIHIPWRHLFGFELFQIFYIVFVGVGGMWGHFTWKGRRFVRGQVASAAQKSV